MSQTLDKDAALQLFLSGYNCSQAVLYSACGPLGLDRELALKIGTGFGAGVARTGGMCGAVSGGVLALSLKYGRGSGDEKATTGDAYERIRAFMDAFEKKHGSVNCRALTGCDFMTPEGERRFKENDLLNRTCAKCVQSAIELLGESL